MRYSELAAGVLLVCLTSVSPACGSQNANNERASEDQGNAPDTTATTPNMITPSDDADTSASAPATTEATGKEVMAEIRSCMKSNLSCLHS
jgi:hypothetical protein